MTGTIKKLSRNWGILEIVDKLIIIATAQKSKIKVLKLCEIYGFFFRHFVFQNYFRILNAYKLFFPISLLGVNRCIELNNNIDKLKKKCFTEIFLP